MLLVLRKKICLLLLATLAFTASSLAQSNVSGTVKDKDGQPIAGVSVTVKGGNKGTSTNTEGDFTLTGVAANASLVFSATGYAQQEAKASASPISIMLLTSVGSMDEVVVIGYGTAKRKDLTGAVATVGEKDFNKGTYTSADQLIQGKVTGVQVINNSGAPGGASTVKIRGNSTVTGNGQPLYVVDGVPLDGRSVQPGLGDIGAGGSNPGSNPLNFINPSDIASIDVLKDASSTAIYGSRAAYGVVLVTTKRGQTGQPKVEFGVSTGFSKILKKLEVLDAAQFRQALPYYGLSASNDRGSSVDALDAILRTGMVNNYNVGVSGGTDASKFRLSFGVLDQEGIVKKDRH